MITFRVIEAREGSGISPGRKEREAQIRIKRRD